MIILPTMKVFNIGLLSISLLTCVKLASTKCQNPYEIEVCYDDLNSRCNCTRCLTCNQGFGQNIECGSGPINHKQFSLRCERCKFGTFSDKIGSAMCQPCPKCSGHKMLQRCTTKSATKCSPDICDKNYEWNPTVEHCEPVPVETHVTTAGPTTKNVKPATPSTSMGKQHDATTLKPSVKMNVILLNKTLRPTIKDEQKGPSAYKQKDVKASIPHLTTVTTIVVFIILLLFVATIAVVAYVKGKRIIKHLRRLSQSKTQPESLIPLNVVEKGSTDSSPELNRQNSFALQQEEQQPSQPAAGRTENSNDLDTYPWSEDLLLNSIPPDLRERIEDYITCPSPTVNGWKQLGLKLGLSEEDMLKVSNQDQAERGYHLFVKLETEMPYRLKLSEFVDKLKIIKRYDVVKLVLDHYRPQDNADL